MTSTPIHLCLYQAMGWEPPQYAHLALLRDMHGNKLSKRNTDTDIASLRDQGILPEALLNYVALLGWSHRESSDFMTLEKLVQTVCPSWLSIRLSLTSYPLVFNEIHKRQHNCGAGETVVSAKGTCPSPLCYRRRFVWRYCRSIV
jgi:glutamyl-tRNA synthetase